MSARELARRWAAPPSTEAEAQQFLADCVAVLGQGFHPDTRFGDYICERRGARRFTFYLAQAARLDRAMDAAVAILPDPYAVGLALIYPDCPYDAEAAT